MTTPPRRDEAHRTIFIGLALILTALVAYFALTLIPSAVRPTLAPSPAPAATTGAPSN